LPAEARVVTPGEATSDALRLSSAYRSNLTALALVALFTGGFLVYSTQTLAVLRRRREFALLHALGMTNRQQVTYLLIGGAVIGALGALVGIALGAVAASYALASLGTDMGAGYFRSGALRLELGVFEVVAFGLLGCATAIAGTLRPALATSKIPTAAALKAGDVASGQTGSHSVLSVMLVGVAVALLFLPPIGTLPLPGYVSIALLILASVTAVATIVRRLLLLLPHSRVVPLQIAVAHLVGTARYVTLSVAAIVVSFSLMVAMVIMVTSFRNSLDAWTQKILPADVYLRSGYIGQTAFFDAPTVERLRSLPGIERLQTARYSQVSIDAARPPLALVARSFDPMHVEDELWIEQRTDAPLPADAVPVWISEAAADLYGLQPGSALVLPLNGRKVLTSVRGLWRDYEHQNGAVLMQRELYQQLTGDAAVNGVGIWTEDAVPVAQVIAAIQRLIPATAAFDLRVPQELRKLSLEVFDRTFAVTYLLEAVAVVIGLLGISASTSAQVLARRGEFGVLRYIGLTRKQIAATLGIEGLLLGSVGVVIGLVTGVVVSMILIYVVNRQSFHWSMDVFIPWTALALLSIMLAGMSALIAVISGRRAMSGDVVAAVKEDW
jgi:putative ABC transport system permease protein